MKFYFKQNKVLFLFTILASVIASLGYVFMAILLQQLLNVAVEKNMQQFIRMVLFSIVYFAVLGSFYISNLCSAKKLYVKSSVKFVLMYSEERLIIV